MALSLTHKRLPICRRCPQWKGSCSKGHVLTEAAGCPEKRFEAVGMPAPDLPAPVVLPASQAALPCPGGCAGSTPNNWAAVVREFGTAMTRWIAHGMPRADTREHDRRVSICTGCENYQNHRCTKCGCFSYIKAKLATEKCPIGRW